MYKVNCSVVCLFASNPSASLGRKLCSLSPTLCVQVCLAALMAQVGAWVPAQSLTLTPVDAIFVRMGAKDDLMAGQSTFFVELAETAAALNRATPASLVALDELGRGTATSDGAAIAAAVLEHLSGKVHCRSGSYALFAAFSVLLKCVTQPLSVPKRLRCQHLQIAVTLQVRHI